MVKIYLLALFLFLLFTSSVSAHQDGCHRWHSCPSDTGSYTCGDLGYTSGCGGSAPVQSYMAPTTPPIAIPTIIPTRIPTRIRTTTLTPTLTPTEAPAPTLT